MPTYPTVIYFSNQFCRGNKRSSRLNYHSIIHCVACLKECSATVRNYFTTRSKLVQVPRNARGCVPPNFHTHQTSAERANPEARQSSAPSIGTPTVTSGGQHQSTTTPGSLPRHGSLRTTNRAYQYISGISDPNHIKSGTASPCRIFIHDCAGAR